MVSCWIPRVYRRREERQVEITRWALDVEGIGAEVRAVWGYPDDVVTGVVPRVVV